MAIESFLNCLCSRWMNFIFFSSSSQIHFGLDIMQNNKRRRSWKSFQQFKFKENKACYFNDMINSQHFSYSVSWIFYWNFQVWIILQPFDFKLTTTFAWFIFCWNNCCSKDEKTKKNEWYTISRKRNGTCTPNFVKWAKF